METVEQLFSHFPADRLEYHRNAAALLPEKDDPDPGVAVLVIDAKKNRKKLHCNCKASERGKACHHVSAFSRALRRMSGFSGDGRIDGVFRSGMWHRIASVLHGACPIDPRSLAPEDGTQGGKQNGRVRIVDGRGETLVDFQPENPDSDTSSGVLPERTGIVSADGNPFHRGRILDMLISMTMSDSEQVMRARGMKTRRMDFEEGFWYRLAYHLRNAAGGEEISLSMEVDESSGRFLIRAGDGFPGLLQIGVPAESAMRVRKEMAVHFGGHEAFTVLPESLESILRVAVDGHNNLKLRLCLLLHNPDGSREIFDRKRLAKYWFGDTLYIPEKKVLATWQKPDPYRELFGGAYSKKISRNRVPEILDAIGDLFSPPNIVEESVSRLVIHREPARVEITPMENAPDAAERDWLSLSVSYGFGDGVSVSLSDIYQAKLAGKRYIAVRSGWIDVRAAGKAIPEIPGGGFRQQLAASDTVCVNRLDLLGLQAAFGRPLSVVAGKEKSGAETIRRLLEMRPAGLPEDFSRLAGTLRQYQRHGAEWMAFLFENELGGLLCDEMGLGKTHQVMTLMAWAAKYGDVSGPCMVVCPTTVISHWARKIREHAPGLSPVVYHGSDREIGDAPGPDTVLITSYGILLRDAGPLGKFRYSVLAFDEAQHLKNPATQSYGAAASLTARLKLSVTGTPVENHPGDLKALMDLVLPGYLGTDEQFRLRQEAGDRQARKDLRRMVRPFTLRRTKAVVLEELPEKIEDLRYCRLNDTQVKLYREAVAGRGRDLMSVLEKGSEPIPYIHIFAMLNLLKQICNHPATVGDSSAKGKKRRTVPKEAFAPEVSGKWELFVELLDSCLDNGEKVVVFSQFVTMVEIILAYLESRNIGSASITGQTRNRGAQIDRFNNDPDCRVFVGSLRAGGSGIDLTGGSAVIHYDRWWNAAREDQATDRVHRIGQTRGVQVFKLVTEGTLEEKIAAIIGRKKRIAGDVIGEDAPGTLKTLSREELMALMTPPQFPGQGI